LNVRNKKKYELLVQKRHLMRTFYVQGGSNMTGTDMNVNKPHCAAAVRP